jgi:hypothetical protein
MHAVYPRPVDLQAHRNSVDQKNINININDENLVLGTYYS